jgi:hypothetical protein
MYGPDEPRFRVPAACRAGVVLLLLLFGFAPDIRAQPGAQQAIERAEGCSPQEQGCVRILRRRAGDDPDTVHIKAEIRGKRIIWYQYDIRTGRVRRLN